MKQSTWGEAAKLPINVASWIWGNAKEVLSDPILTGSYASLNPLLQLLAATEAYNRYQKNKELDKYAEMAAPFKEDPEKFKEYYERAVKKYGEEEVNKALQQGISPKDYLDTKLLYHDSPEYRSDYKNTELDPYGRPAYAMPDYGAGLNPENVTALMNMYEEQDQAAAEDNARKEYLMNLVNSFAPPKRDFNITPQLSNLKLYEGKFGK